MSVLDDAPPAAHRRPHGSGEPAEVQTRFEQHRALASRVARRHLGTGDIDDVVELAEAALLAACRTYEPSDGAFERVAVLAVLSELRSSRRSGHGGDSASRRLRDDTAKVVVAIDRLSVEFGRSPRLTELADACHLTVARVARVVRGRTRRSGRSGIGSTATG